MNRFKSYFGESTSFFSEEYKKKALTNILLKYLVSNPNNLEVNHLLSTEVTTENPSQFVSGDTTLSKTQPSSSHAERKTNFHCGACFAWGCADRFKISGSEQIKAVVFLFFVFLAVIRKQFLRM